MKFNSLFYILFITLTIIACSNTKENKHARIIWDKYENGNPKTVHQFFTDTVNMTEEYYYQEFYENGKLKMEGLEKQSLRKGEWLVYYDNGDIKAKLNFDNDKLNGLIELYDKNGLVTAKYIAANGYLNQGNDDIVQLLLQYFHSENRPIWTDSLNNKLDTLTTTFNKKQ
jgi:hypothetical protein